MSSVQNGTVEMDINNCLMTDTGVSGREVMLYLGLGSNLGDRRHNLLEAVRCLDMAFAVNHDALSSFVETEPWGFDSDDIFLNAAVRYRLSVPRGTSMNAFAHEILRKCKSVEAEMGRTGKPEYDSDGRRIYRSRIIDIDILLLGDFRIDDSDLKIPHPLMAERDFVMIPLREIVSHRTMDSFPDIFFSDCPHGSLKV